MKMIKLASLFGAVAIALAGCGGGGGGGTTTPPPPPPVATGSLTGTTGCQIAENATSCSATIKATTQNASAPKTYVGTTLVSTQASVDTTFTIGNGDVTVTLMDGSSTLKTMTITGGCASGTTWDGSVCRVPVVAWWPPATITSMDVKVFGANDLPAACTTWNTQCWKDSVANGTVKFVETSATMTGYNSRPVVFAYYKNASGFWNSLPIYRDDGTLVGSDIFGGSSSEVDWVMGNAVGIIVHEKSSGICTQVYWYSQGFTWSSRPTTCPQ